MEMETNFEWSNKMGHRDLSAWLLLVAENTIHVFTGADIPGVVIVVGHDYEKSGKWSHTTYRLYLAPGVRAIPGHNGWETGRFVEGLREATSFPGHIDRWVDVSNALGVMISEAQRFLREWRPEAAEALDNVEKSFSAIAEKTNGDFDIIAVSFGGPTNRLIDEGFWEWPVSVIMPDGQGIGQIVPNKYGEYALVREGDINILAVEHSSGHHGGYVSMRLLVPSGAVAVHGPAGDV